MYKNQFIKEETRERERMLKTQLPSPNQVWAHSTCCLKDLHAATNDTRITAIEADILMGQEQNHSGPKCPIMAHPPDTMSDLSFDRFINHVIASKRCQHVKLDFKDIESVDPVLHKLSMIESKLCSTQTIFLNADILSGPGKRHAKLQVPHDEFLGKCMNFITNSKRRHHFAFSLGFMVDCRSMKGYSDQDIKILQDVIINYSLVEKSIGVVLAVNARVLCKRLDAFDKILDEIPQLQLLAWTATGEPPISKYQIEKIRRHFSKTGKSEVGFDCLIAKNCIAGFFFDWIVRIVSVFWNLKQIAISMSLKTKVEITCPIKTSMARLS